MIFENLPMDKTNPIILNRIEVKLTDPDGKPIRNWPYTLELRGGEEPPEGEEPEGDEDAEEAAGEVREGMTDGTGTLTEWNVPPGSEAVVRLGGREEVVYVKPE